MEGEHAKMQQIRCKMTGSSSKLLQIQGKWHPERNLKKIPHMTKNQATIFHPEIQNLHNV
jgi:hypothetical protein